MVSASISGRAKLSGGMAMRGSGAGDQPRAAARAFRRGVVHWCAGLRKALPVGCLLHLRAHSTGSRVARRQRFPLPSVR
jgi:hypothetical protein